MVSGPPSVDGLRYLPALDGVRAVAIVFVILFHFGWVDWGWMGVSIFFVLSGYLITRQLLATKHWPWRRYLSNFYARRFWRIFPLYYGFLGVVTLVYVVRHQPSGFAPVAPYLFTYTLNVAAWVNTPIPDYFAHLWSLAVEEQFYLVWPVLVYVLSPKIFNLFLAAIICVSPLARLGALVFLPGLGYDAAHTASLIYYTPLSQFEGFAWGALVAGREWPRLSQPRRVLYAGLGVMLALGLLTGWGYAVHLPHHAQAVWGYSLIYGLAALMVLSESRGQKVARWLEWPWVRRIGKISYGLYILHLPVLVLFRKAFQFVDPFTLAGVITFPIYLIVLVGLCELSYRLWEQPWLRWHAARRSA